MSFYQFTSEDIVIHSLQDVFEHEELLMDIFNSTDKHEIPSTEETMAFVTAEAPHLLPEDFLPSEPRKGGHPKGRGGRGKFRRRRRPIIIRRPYRKFRPHLNRRLNNKPHYKPHILRRPIYHRRPLPHRKRRRFTINKLLKALLIGSLLPYPSHGKCVPLYGRNRYGQVVPKTDFWGHPRVDCHRGHYVKHCVQYPDGSLSCKRPKPKAPKPKALQKEEPPLYPPSDGVTVEDDNTPDPPTQKNKDAAEGYINKRGDKIKY